MLTLEGLLRRLGFVRLRHYGLELTRDGRVRSTHGAVRSDGWGGPIVGWSQDDVAARELPPWQAARIAAAPSAPGSEDDDWERVLAFARRQRALEPAPTLPA